MTKAADLSKTGSLVNSSGQIDLTTGVTGVLPVANGGTGSSGGVSPGGSNTQVQYNNAGAFGGSSTFVFDGTNVGIGTSSPSQRLDVQAADYVAVRTLSTNSSIDTRLQSYSTGNYGYVGTISNHAFSVITNNTERMRIDTSGNVGIGTSSPGALGLTINKTSGTSSGLQLYQSGSEVYRLATDNTAVYVQAIANIPMQFYTNNTERMRIDSSGNVGIGTSSPNGNARLTVAGTTGSGTGGGILITGSGYQTAPPGMVLGQYTSTIAYIQAPNNGQIDIWDDASNSIAQFKDNGNFAFNSGYGSAATAYGCRAWVNFNGSGTLSIKASGNVTSVTDNGTGDYTVNFTTAMPDANYAIATCGVIPDDAGGAPAFFLKGPTGWGSNPTLKSTTQARMLNRRETNLDMSDCSVSIFR